MTTEAADAYVPRRHRMDRPPLREVARPNPSIIEDIKPMSEDIAKEALRFHTMVQNAIKERNDLAERLNEANARIEQFQISLTQRDSTIEQLTLERNGARESCIWYRATLSGLGNSIADSLGQAPETEADSAG